MEAAYITTSWDDGHPLDFRVAELLSKHGLRGTFYIPRMTERATMSELDVRRLSAGFEIGAHTLRHIVLTRVPTQEAWAEIAGSKSWIEDSTGAACLGFCPPTGRYTDRHVEMAKSVGFLGFRSAELMSIAFPHLHRGLMLMPTTVQAYPHRAIAFAKNAIKRAAFKNLWRVVLYGRSSDWPALAHSLMTLVLTHGGVFHLWGHSWELQEQEQWKRLDNVLRFLSEHRRQAPPLTNGEVCNLAHASHCHGGARQACQVG
jgi:peptidoglycan/xylan/chitin deacetylase (PgdA/CDA1 family)